MLELKNISKQFGQHKIFDNYNLTVEEGKILAIVGSIIMARANATRCFCPPERE